MKTNKELQEELSRFPDDYPVAIAIKYNENMSLFYELKVAGIKAADMKIVIINNPDIDEEYEALFNGEDVNEEIYS